MRTVYISGPLSNGHTSSPDARMENVYRGIDVFFALAEAGMSGYLPHFTEYAERRYPGRLSFDKWIELDLPWVRKADTLLRLPGPSKGADLEVAEAERCHVPVFYSLSDLLAFASLESDTADYLEVK